MSQVDRSRTSVVSNAAQRPWARSATLKPRWFVIDPFESAAPRTLLLRLAAATLRRFHLDFVGY